MTLNLNPEPASRKKSKSYKKSLRVGGAISLLGVGSTFAANISLNNDQNVEFGQGVAQTLSCDDEVNINPVSYYDNVSGTFRVDYVEVSGINLIPVGAISDSYNSSTGEYEQYADASAIAAHPGQYIDSTNNNTWTNTCDQVVLDFKAFTDNPQYSTNTLDGYNEVDADSNATPNTISSPLFWATNGQGQNPGVTDSNNEGYITNFAVVFHSVWNGYYQDYNIHRYPNYSGAANYINDIDSNYVNLGTAYNSYYGGGEQYAMSLTSPGDDGGTGYVKESSFRIFADDSHQHNALDRGDNEGYDPIAGAIAKITVESMRYFPTDYYLLNSNTGALGKKPTS